VVKSGYVFARPFRFDSRVQANQRRRYISTRNEGCAMRRSTILTVFLSIAAGYVLAMALNRTSTGQPSVPEAAVQGQVRRYQLTHAGDDRSPVLFLTDTVTGRVWWHGSNVDTEWHAFGLPAEGNHDSGRR
jgi:hypothetical protein